VYGRIEDLGRGDFVNVDCSACYHVALLTPTRCSGLISAPGPRCSISAVSLELGYLTFCLFASDSVAFLDPSYELITLSFDNRPVIVGQSSPGLLSLSDELFPSSFGLVSVHLEPSAKSNGAFETARKGSGSPLPGSSRVGIPLQDPSNCKLNLNQS
jgi:hypothetical protein